jgi:hypothetical protein
VSTYEFSNPDAVPIGAVFRIIETKTAGALGNVLKLRNDGQRERFTQLQSSGDRFEMLTMLPTPEVD